MRLVLMWLFVGGLVLGLFGVLDLLINLVAVRILGFGIVELGVLNAVWTILIIPSLRHANAFSNAGVTKKPVVMSLVFLIVLVAFLYESIELKVPGLIYLAYGLHAISYAYAKTSCQTAVLESFPSDKWPSVNRRLSQTSILFDGVLLIILSKTWPLILLPEYYTFFSVTAIASLGMLLAAIPQPKYRFERIISRIENYMKRGLTRIHGFVALTSIDYVEKSYLNSIADKYIVSGLGLSLILASLASFRVGNEYLFTPLPYIFIILKGLHIRDVLFIYGVSKIISFILLFLIPRNVVSKGMYLVSIILRVLGVVAIMIEAPDPLYASLMLATIYVTNLIIDTTLYAHYLETTGGSNIGWYSLTAEFASFIGTLTSGLVFQLVGLVPMSCIILFLGFLPILILKSRW
ncbi:hypothetical protein ACSU1N_00325 [Thermogladius sp. 4427co]|uniref:hypothetical protein n=1 Tax=Thermogladius sp. 4427co TaxID=3450718 RepID=UPI003F7AEE39